MIGSVFRGPRWASRGGAEAQENRGTLGPQKPRRWAAARALAIADLPLMNESLSRFNYRVITRVKRRVHAAAARQSGAGVLIGQRKGHKKTENLGLHHCQVAAVGNANGVGR